MIERIDFFMPPPNPYGMVSSITKAFFEAVQRQGVQCRLLTAQRDNPKPFLDSLFSDPPECTLSFNGLLPDPKGNFFCNMIKIPHVAFLIDSPYQFVPLTQSPLNIILCPDIFAWNFFMGLNFDNVLFLPHGASRDIAKKPNNAERKYDVVMLASCIDYESVRDDWKKKYPPNLHKILENASERSLAHPQNALIESLVGELNDQLGRPDAVNPAEINILELLDEMETFIKGKDRIELIKSIKDCKVDVFGAPCKTAGWEKLLAGTSATVHGPIPYDEALNVMKQSKIVLTSCPWSRNGGDERVFAALACGALVITSDNAYLRQHFKEGSDILFYQPNKWAHVNDLVHQYLSDSSKRESIASKGRKKTLDDHTWDVRAKVLLEGLGPLLEKVKPD